MMEIKISHLKMEISQSQDLEGNAMKEQTPAVIQTTAIIPIVIFEID
jgi:hypothetical protein